MTPLAGSEGRTQGRGEQQAGEMGCAIGVRQPTATGKKNHCHRRTVGSNEQSELHRLFGQAGWQERGWLKREKMGSSR
ncbi:hypothetical protein JUNP479_3949 [Aeromonas jandaei]|nr:hypothetical protein JUNP479_3949 [Aeromonas jandaei]